MRTTLKRVELGGETEIPDDWYEHLEAPAGSDDRAIRLPLLRPPMPEYEPMGW